MKEGEERKSIKFPNLRSMKKSLCSFEAPENNFICSSESLERGQSLFEIIGSKSRLNCENNHLMELNMGSNLINILAQRRY